MPISVQIKNNYTRLLYHELILSQGCTEPASIAYAGALCRAQLNLFPEHMKIACSENLFKNAKSAIIPNTDQLKGIAAACVCGAVCGENASMKLEILETMTPERLFQVHSLLENGFCEVTLLNTPEKLHIIAEAWAQGEHALVEITHEHTHVARIEKNGLRLCSGDVVKEIKEINPEDVALNPRDIYQFTEEAELTGRLGELLRTQMEHNVAICAEGMQHKWGANIGNLIADEHADTEKLACAFAAAGSDARMSGCAMPVVINSGSGNQGITITAPIYIYARALRASEERTLRALLLANLMSLYLKGMIGKLSAYCGAVSAGSAAGAGIAYLKGATAEQIAFAFANSAASISGMLCDGAKPSCAAKIACSVYSGILAQKMAMSGNNFLSGDGIVGSTPECTIHNVGNLARNGFVEIDRLILNTMYATLPKEESCSAKG